MKKNRKRNPKITFRHLQPKYAGRTTIAYMASPEKDGEVTYYAGITYCSPKDRFVRSYGLDKAQGRLMQLTASADGWRLAAENPDKFQIVTVKADKEGNTLQEFVNVLDTIVEQFVPEAVRQAFYEAQRRAFQ